MNHKDFWVFKLTHVMMANVIICEAIFLSKEKYEAELLRVTEAMVKREWYTVKDDFGADLLVNCRMVGTLFGGAHSVFHKRHIDISDTQEHVADNYQPDSGKKSKFIGGD